MWHLQMRFHLALENAAQPHLDMRVYQLHLYANSAAGCVEARQGSTTHRCNAEFTGLSSGCCWQVIRLLMLPILVSCQLPQQAYREDSFV